MGSGFTKPTSSREERESPRREQSSSDAALRGDDDPAEAKTTDGSRPLSPCERHGAPGNQALAGHDARHDNWPRQADAASCLALMQNCEFWTAQERDAVLAHLESEGADLDLNARDHAGNTVLLLAAIGKQVRVAQELLRLGANPNEQNDAGFCALHYCCETPSVHANLERGRALASALLQACANPNLVEANAGCAPLHYAAAENCLSVCDLLLDSGANAALRCKQGFLPEAYARAAGHDGLADYLHDKARRHGLSSAIASDEEAAVAQGWRKMRDANSTRFFYYNEITGQSTWDRPIELDLERSKARKVPSGARRSNPGGPGHKSNQYVPEREVLQRQLAEMQARLREAQLRADREAEQAAAIARIAQEADARFVRELAALRKDLERRETGAGDSHAEIERLKADFEASKRLDMDRLRNQFEEQRSKERADLEKQRDAERQRHHEELQQRMAEMQRLEQQLARELREKKQYYNEIEDLKGAIRVCARVRPLLRGETSTKSSQGAVEVLGDNIKVAHVRKDRAGEKSVSKTWTFDKVFGPQRGQADVFEDTERLVQSALDGYNVCIFAYGQTGAGKTHTMTGSPSDPGICPRAVKKLFAAMDEQSENADFSVDLYMCELYRETLVDLLAPQAPHLSPPQHTKNSMSVKKDHFGVVYVENITVVPIATETELLEWIRAGEARRTTDVTKMNDASSRSHLVVSIVVKSESKISGELTSGKITLVDLAGSERVAKSGAEGESLKEATSINKALSALGDVINALSTNAKYVPYRNNPLTQLMSDSIGGNAKTLMIVNVSPADCNSAETMASLNFASRCKTIKNTASKGFETRELAALRKEIAKLRVANKGATASSK